MFLLCLDGGGVSNGSETRRHECNHVIVITTSVINRSLFGCRPSLSCTLFNKKRPPWKAATCCHSSVIDNRPSVPTLCQQCPPPPHPPPPPPPPGWTSGAHLLAALPKLPTPSRSGVCSLSRLSEIENSKHALI